VIRSLFLPVAQIGSIQIVKNRQKNFREVFLDLLKMKNKISFEMMNKQMIKCMRFEKRHL